MSQNARSIFTRSIVAAALVLCAASAYAQGTPIPYTIPQYLDANGDPLASGGLCTYEAGTTTLATVYTTAALSVAHPNPVRFNAAGRPTVSGATLGIFLTPGQSYKLVLKDATVTTCSPDTGVTLWSVDNVSAVPGSASAVDVSNAVAGEAIAAGDAVFMSDGSNALSAGQWYRTDSDLAYRSLTAPLVGVAPNAIAAAASGSVRLSGPVSVTGPLSTGAPYYAGSTAGAIVATAPANALKLGAALSPTSLIVGDVRAAPIGPRGAPCGRLSLTTGLAVTPTDVTAATTLYYVPYGGCTSLSLFDGTAYWYPLTLTQLSIAVPATTATMYDVFVYDNAGTPTLELTAWTNDTTRATALTTQNGVYVKTGALTRLYLGSFRTTAVSGQTEDSLAKRYVWNYYNRVIRPLRVKEGTDSWNYTTATFRQANNSTANQLDIVVGVAEDAFSAYVAAIATNTTGGVLFNVSISEDSATVPSSNVLATQINYSGVGQFTTVRAELITIPAAGRHFYAWLEFSAATGTTSWYGDNASATLFQSGIAGLWKS